MNHSSSAVIEPGLGLKSDVTKATDKKKKGKKKVNFPSGTVKKIRQKEKEKKGVSSAERFSLSRHTQDDLHLYDGSKSCKSLLPIINPAALIHSNRDGRGCTEGKRPQPRPAA